MSPTKTTTTRRRMSSAARRAAIVEAATRAFARTGYAGTSTDAVGKEADVSQSYVVRTFGTKLNLFLEVFDTACGRIQRAFEEVIRDRFLVDDDDSWARLGAAYAELLHDRDLLMVMMHGFAAGDDDRIAARARENFATIFATIKATGCTPERAQEFMAQGMLLNVMTSMRALDHLDENADLEVLAVCAFGDALQLLS